MRYSIINLLISIFILAACEGSNHNSDQIVSTSAGSGQNNGGNTISITNPPQTPIAARGSGCHLASYNNTGRTQFACGLLSSFGDFQFDTIWREEIAIQQNFFGDNAVVEIYNECDISNANALSHPDNFILFGYYLAQKAILNYRDTLPMAVVLAHEFGHQLQFRNGWINNRAGTARASELEADGWAGFYIALTKVGQVPQSSLTAAAQQVVDIGDYNFSDPTHHGTPFERLSMYAAGFQVAIEHLNEGPFNQSEVHNRIIAYRDRSLGTNFSDSTNMTALAKSIEPLLDKSALKLISDISKGNASINDFKFPASFYDGDAAYPVDSNLPFYRR